MSNQKILVIFFSVFILQLVLTKTSTRKGIFSKRAFLRNFFLVLSVFLFVEYKNPLFLLLPILVEICIETLKFKGYHLEPWIATTNLYDDYFSPLVERNPHLSSFSEGLYDHTFGFNTLDQSPKNIRKLLDWSLDINQNPSSSFEDLNGKKWEGWEIKKLGEINKFKKICDICGVTSSSRILEIGFGEGDFMDYIRKNYHTDPVGISISKEQVDKARSRGFIAYEMNYMKIKPEELGTFDIILQLGNIEYAKLSGQDEEKIYSEYGQIISQMLCPGGKYFITGIHLNEKFRDYSCLDMYNAYILWSGNDGYYPKTKHSFSNPFKKQGLVEVWREDRTIDYYLSSVFYFSTLFCGYSELCKSEQYQKNFKNALLKTFCDPYFIHSFICYSPNKNIYAQPWIWQFTPQEQLDGSFLSPVSLEYILFLK